MDGRRRLRDAAFFTGHDNEQYEPPAPRHGAITPGRHFALAELHKDKENSSFVTLFISDFFFNF